MKFLKASFLYHNKPVPPTDSIILLILLKRPAPAICQLSKSVSSNGVNPSSITGVSSFATALAVLRANANAVNEGLAEPIFAKKSGFPDYLCKVNAKKIKSGEQKALEYFQFKGYTDIVYEPNPDHPPDLLINKTIAVEARRLNQFKNLNGINKPLEDLGYTLMPKIIRLIRSYDAQPSALTSFVSVGYKRPLRITNKKTFKEIERVLHEHLSILDQTTFYNITPTLQLRFRPSVGTKKYNKPYLWASSHDNDSGGFVVANMIESLDIIIKEKEAKIQQYRDQYPIWWLAVTDTISFGIDDTDFSQIFNGFNIETFFEKIIFISPSDSTYGKELIIKK